MTHGDDVIEETEQMKEKSSCSLPLAMFGLALASLFIGLCYVNVIKPSLTVATVMFVGGIALFIAGIMEVKKENALNSTSYFSLAFFWLAFSTLFAMSYLKYCQLDGASICTMFIIWGTFTLILSLITKGMGRIMQIGHICLAGMMIAAAIFHYGSNNDISLMAGTFGIISGLVFFYIAIGTLLNENYDITIVPLK